MLQFLWNYTFSKVEICLVAYVLSMTLPVLEAVSSK